MIIKLGYLVDAKNFDANVKQVEREVDEYREWVEYNDMELRHVTRNWPAVIEYCIDNRMYPTVLFFEKLAEEEEEDAEYKMSEEFNVTDSDIRDLSSLAIS